MIRFSLLGSGSSGNAILATSNTTKILIDNGLSFKQLRLRSDEVGLSIDDLDAVFITHEHGDHVLGLGTLARRIGAPVFMTRGTYESLPPSLGALPNVVLFEAGDTIPIGNVQIES
ncbi:MAG: MBL fold metallo-hydrolase, partial [Candidatus Hydrogenedentes bacterium]|nr:MBL fold metallo-hydrolase [Candidatus Hydrogenedentota bacterium]